MDLGRIGSDGAGCLDRSLDLAASEASELLRRSVGCGGSDQMRFGDNVGSDGMGILA